MIEGADFAAVGGDDLPTNVEVPRLPFEIRLDVDNPGRPVSVDLSGIGTENELLYTTETTTNLRFFDDRIEFVDADGTTIVLNSAICAGGASVWVEHVTEIAPGLRKGCIHGFWPKSTCPAWPPPHN
jgi:hypothetical protein